MDQAKEKLKMTGTYIDPQIEAQEITDREAERFEIRLLALADCMTDMGCDDMGWLTEKLAARFHRATDLIRSISDDLKTNGPA
jgi:hypothetical protein